MSRDSRLRSLSLSFALPAICIDLKLLLDPFFLLSRMRDSALSAVAMSCRNLQELYFTILLQDVTLHLDFILSFRSCLIENPDYGNMIKSIHFKGFTSTITDRDVTALQQGLRAVFSRLDTSKDSTVQFAGGVIEVQQFIYENMGCLQTLIVENDMFIPNHFDRVPSFSNSLKKIFIALGDHTRPDPCAPLTAKNVIWILSFGQIEMAALGFSISVFDFSFLHEHAQYFTATSKVKKLALRFSFVFKETDRRTWWGSQSQRNKVVKHTNVKTEAVALILSLVNNLECLEVLCVDQEKFNPGDGATLNLDYLSDLEQSLGSLRHLRLLDSENITAADWPSFQSLYVLSLDGYLLSQLYGSNKPALPVSLETIILSHYDSFDEDLSLIKVIKSHYLPNLKEVILPSETIGPDESGLEDPQTSEELDLWAQRRRDLENEEIFKSGTVRLRQFNWGEVGE